jgi:hypothetical protein
MLPSSQLIFPSKTWFFGFFLNFQQQKSLKNQYLPHSQSRSYQINSIKSCSSRAFQQHQRHLSIPPKISAMIYFNFQWRSHSIFNNFYTRSPMHPSLSESFPKTPRTWSDASWFSGSHNYKTKQNKTNYLPS